MGKRSSTKGWSRKARKRHKLDKYPNNIDNVVYQQYIEKFGHKLQIYRRLNLKERKEVASNLYQLYVFDEFPKCDFSYIVKTQIERLLNLKNYLTLPQDEVKEYFCFAKKRFNNTINFELVIEL